MTARDENILQTRLSRVVGHASQKEQLLSLIAGDGVPHALLFVGPAGVGKRALAQEYAREILLGAIRSESDAAQSARLFDAGHFPDIHTVMRDPEKKDISVEQIRELCTSLTLKPYFSKYRAAILDDADLMSPAAANALLKTLEEPSPDTYLFLITSAPQKVPETILSRCQQVPCGELSTSEVSQVLKTTLEILPSEQEDASALLALCNGSLAALSLESFLDPKTHQLVDSAGARKRASELVGTAKTLISSLDRLFVSPSGHPISDALVLSSTLTGSENSKSELWSPLRGYFRQKLLTSSPRNTPFWAEALLGVLKVEVAVMERNANAATLLADFLVKTAHLAPTRSKPA